VCTVASVLAFSAISISQGIDPQEVLQYFSWIAYVLIAAAYSAFVFSGELSRDGPLIFSKQNTRSAPQVIAVHLAYLTILLCLLRLASYIVLTLPHWMTDTFSGGRRNSRISIADLSFFALSATIALIERKRLYVQSESDSAEPDESPTVPNAE
jgi:hypothetical protein